MTLAIIGAALGLILGAWRARKSGGNRFDQVQYALVFAMIFGLAGMIVAILAARNF